MNKLKHTTNRRWVIGWVGLLTLLGVGMAASGALDWPLIDTGQVVRPTDFRQAVTSVVFNLWFLASMVTVFAVVQQMVQRPARARNRVPAEGGLTRREFLLVTGSLSVAASGLASAVALLRGNLLSETVDPVSTTSDALSLVEDVSAEATALPPTPVSTVDLAAATSETAGITAATVAPSATALPTANLVPTATLIPMATATTAQVVATGVRLCNRGCSYPGHCRQYQDGNANGICDRTEAIW